MRRKSFVFISIQKTKERVIEGELKCEKCSRKFHVKNGIVCFTSCSKRFKISKRQLRKITIKQEIPQTWIKLFSREELTALREEWNWMLSVIPKRKSAVHLDFATGTGRFLRNIVSKTKGEIIALEHDYSTCVELQYFLKRIKKYNHVSIVCADARKMPFKKETFDSVTSWHGLDEPKMEKAIQESKRVLKRGGYFAASGIHYQKRSKSFLRAKKHRINFVTKEAIIRTVKETDFRKIEHKTFFQGKWNEKKSYLPIFGDLYSTYAIKARNEISYRHPL